MSTRAAQRLGLLIEQLGEEEGRTRGWKSRVAKRLGINRSYVSRLARGTDVPGVGRSVIERVVENLGIDESFFSDPGLEQPHYRQFLRGQADRPGWRAARDSAFGQVFALLNALADIEHRADKGEDVDAELAGAQQRLGRAVAECPLVTAALVAAKADSAGMREAAAERVVRLLSTLDAAGGGFTEYAHVRNEGAAAGDERIARQRALEALKDQSRKS